MSAIRRVGIIGLGKMGNPMARHLRKAGFEVTGYDVDDVARREAGRSGIARCRSPPRSRGRATSSSSWSASTRRPKRCCWRRAASRPPRVPGLIVGIASTVAPRTMARLAAHLADSGIVLLDMPITRGEPAAEAGQLLVMVGGDAQAFEACRPALESFASSIFHLGDLGAGQVGKMVNNLILWSCISANHEGFKLAEKLGVDQERLRAALIEQRRELGDGDPPERPCRCPGPRRTCGSCKARPIVCG